MTDHFDLTDAEFYDQMESCTLKKKYFSHSAHLRLAWIHINKYGAGKAQTTTSAQIKKYVTHLGLADKFNLTLSIAAVKIIEHHRKISNAISLAELIKKTPRLQDSFREILEVHYSDKVYSAIEAKESFMKPDRQPFNEQ